MTTDTNTRTDFDEDKTGPDGSPRKHWTAMYGGERTEWRRHTWPIDDARVGLIDAWLADGVKEPSTTDPAEILDEDGQAIAYLIGADRYREMTTAVHEVEAMKDQPEDGRLHWAMHGPYAGAEDALLVDTTAIRSELAWLLAAREADGERPKRGAAEVEWEAWRADVKARADVLLEDERSYLLIASVHIALTTAPYPDEHGVIPLRAWGSRQEGAETPARWQLAYTTPARGLFVRGGQPGFFGEEYAVVTGSGYTLRGGFTSREVAADYAVAIAKAVPGIDFRVWSSGATDLPPEVYQALVKVSREWDQFGLRKATATTGQPSD